MTCTKCERPSVLPAEYKMQLCSKHYIELLNKIDIDRERNFRARIDRMLAEKGLPPWKWPSQ